MTCADVQEHIDLYAADECAGAVKDALFRHVAGCARCARTLEEARALHGLLSLRLRERDNLQALHARLRGESRRQRLTILSLAKRAAAVAAMLFVMVGALALLGLWQPRQLPDAGPQVAVLWQSDDAEIRRSAPNRIEVLAGQVHLEVVPGTAKGKEADVEIHTPGGLARVKESRLFVEVAPPRDARAAGADAAVLVLSGQVDFRNAKGQTAVHRGEVVEASKNAPPQTDRVNDTVPEKLQHAPAVAPRRDWGRLFRSLTAERTLDKNKEPPSGPRK